MFAVSKPDVRGSGGHNLLVIFQARGPQITGMTLVGDAFDKVAREWESVGGLELEEYAALGYYKKYLNQMTVPFASTKEKTLNTCCDFSYSGLKTNTKELIHKHVKGMC
eukprot:Mrub_01410.p7 GENE.Mrub_01410~~Mrub_01410.p7  ORF type:complete len:109 (-),score=19.60 Mrub_01410:1267-1593(-)